MNALFDPALIRLRRARATNRHSEDAGFLHDYAATIIAERLAATNRSFSAPGLLFNGPFASQVISAITTGDAPVSGSFERLAFPRGTSEALSIAPESLDLAISVFDLHRINDLAGMLFQVNRALKPDGLFMAVIPCETTLEELRQALLAAEIEARNGGAPRVDPFAQLRQLGDLLQRTGFKLPVADREDLCLRYASPDRLIADLRDSGGTAAMASRNPPLSRQIWQRAEAIYRERYEDAEGKLPATVSLGFLSGWKVHESQQKPLTPGSAEHSLAEILDRKRKKTISD